MHRDIHLFIGNKELDFSSTPDILYNFDMANATNPTIVKNSFTKTITVEGTSNNNMIFNSIWNLGQTQPVGGSFVNYFNPSKRVEFTLFVDGDVYETGYCKLDSIQKTHNSLLYNITLFGGLGDFFYNLSYDDNGNELKLRDLTYTNSSDPASELDFNITKETVNAAWNRLQYGTGATKWDIINFAPAYNGVPDALNADKVLINTKGFDTTLRKYDGGSITDVSGFPTTISGGYSLQNGYALAQTNGNLTEWDMRDLRSYLQRPVIRVKSIIEACSNPTQNGGYEVDLDSDFFNTGNTFYNDAWITLPMFTDLEFATTTQNWSLHIGSTIKQSGYYNTTYEFAEDSARGASTANLSITFRPKLEVSNVTQPSTGVSSSTLYTSSFIDGANSRIDYASYVYQFIAYDTQNNVIGGSDIYNLTSEVNGLFLNLKDTLYSPYYTGGTIYNRLGYFTKVGNTDIYEWPEDLTLTINTSGLKVAKVALNCKMEANLTDYEGLGKTYGRRQGRLYASTAITEAQYSGMTKYAKWNEPVVSGSCVYNEDSQINSGAKITKQTLLSVDGTPCSYLIDYCKNFGLYFEKDPLQKKIYIRTRSGFYDGNVQNWDDRIDRSKEINIQPITFDSKWYSYNYTKGNNSALADKYYDKWGIDYGTQKVNTGYNFDSETKDLLEGTVFKNGVEGLIKSPYYKYALNNNKEVPNFLFSWVTYSLFNSSLESASVELASPNSTLFWDYGEYGEMYDFFPKVQLYDKDKKTLDGSGILLFYNGMKATEALVNGTFQSVPYNLTDDLNMMISLNSSNPCWLYTKTTTDNLNNVIAIQKTSLPSFGRYKMEGNFISASWDFGKVKELYTPLSKYVENANIYERFWSKYVSDLYDVNSRVLECFVNLPNTQGISLLKNFYWFDDSIWIINKITDWNISNMDTTKVEFIKVQDVNNYSEYATPVVPTAETFSVTGTTTPNTIPASGGTFTLTLTSNKRWYADDDNIYYGDTLWGIIPNFAGGHYSGVTTFTGCTATENTVTVEKVVSIGCEDDFDNWVHFNITQAQGTEPPTPTAETFSVTGITTPSIIPYNGGSFTLTINSNMRWYADDDNIYYGDTLWGTIPNFAGAHSSGITTFTGCTATADTTGLDKAVIIGCENDYDEWAHFVITQSGNPNVLVISPSAITVGAASGSVTFTANTTGITYNSQPSDWLNISSSVVGGHTILTVTYDELELARARVVSIIIQKDSQRATAYLSQRES